MIRKMRFWSLGLFLSIFIFCQDSKVEQNDKLEENDKAVIVQSFQILQQLITTDSLLINSTIDEDISRSFQLQAISQGNSLTDQCKQLISTTSKAKKINLSIVEFKKLDIKNLILTRNNGFSLSEIIYDTCEEEKVAHLLVYWKNEVNEWLGVSFLFKKNGNKNYYKLEAFNKVNLELN